MDTRVRNQWASYWALWPASWSWPCAPLFHAAGLAALGSGFWKPSYSLPHHILSSWLTLTSIYWYIVWRQPLRELLWIWFHQMKMRIKRFSLLSPKKLGYFSCVSLTNTFALAIPLIKKHFLRTSLVQWLRLHTSNAEGTGSVSGRGTKIPHAMPCSQKEKKKKSSFSCDCWEGQNRWRGLRGTKLQL